MPAEWQARQLLLSASEPGPWNIRSPNGRSTFNDFRTNLSWAWAASAMGAATMIRPIDSAWRNMFSPLRYDNRRLLDDVAHEPAWIPIGRVGLRLAAAVGAADHQHGRSPLRRGKAELPLAEAVLPFVLAELCLLPALAPVAGEVDARDARIAAECDPTGECGGTALQRRARLDVGDEGARPHAADWDRFEAGLSRLDIGVGCIGDGVGRLRPEIRIGLLEHLDVIEHLDPVSRIPTGYDQAEWKSVKQRERLPIHAEGEHDFAVAGMIDIE